MLYVARDTTCSGYHLQLCRNEYAICLLLQCKEKKIFQSLYMPALELHKTISIRLQQQTSYSFSFFNKTDGNWRHQKFNSEVTITYIATQRELIQVHPIDLDLYCVVTSFLPLAFTFFSVPNSARFICAWVSRR